MWLKILSTVQKVVISLVVLGLLFWIFIWNFSFVFKTRVIGEVQKVEHVGAQAVITNNQPINPQVFSFSVAIKDLKTNQIHMASSEDRKWGAVQAGNCVVAAFFPYEPWKLSKGTTDFNARLLQNYVTCNDVPSQDSLWDSIKFFFLWF